MYDTLQQAYAAVCKERDELACKYRKALDDLVKQSHETKSEWISVKDRLPDKKCMCLVYAPHYFGQTHICNDVAYSTFQPNYKQPWSIVRGGHGNAWRPWEITHWMPLPEPPEVK